MSEHQRERVRNPYERQRLALVEQLTDETTAARLLGLIEEGGIPNVEEAVEKGIFELYQDRIDRSRIWRYVCFGCVPECSDTDGFISGAVKSRAELELGIRTHCSANPPHDVVVFTYDPDGIEWDPERIEEIAAAHRVDDDLHDAILEVATADQTDATTRKGPEEGNHA